MKSKLAPWMATLGIIGLGLSIAGCGIAPQPADGNGRPRSPLDLPAVSADLELSGPVTGHVTEARASQCMSKKEGSLTSFYGSIYFKASGQWYYLQLIGLNPVPARGRTSGYSGPGRYQAEVDFREVVVTAAGMTVGTHAWGVPQSQSGSLTVSNDGRTVSIGSFTGSMFQPELSDHTELWPQRPDQTGPPPFPVPSPEQILMIHGSWTCP
jgi:hypothetical protein